MASFQEWLQEKYPKNALLKVNFDPRVPNKEMFEMIGDARYKEILEEIHKRAAPEPKNKDDVKTQFRDLILAKALLEVHKHQYNLAQLTTETPTTEKEEKVHLGKLNVYTESVQSEIKKIQNKMDKLKLLLESMKKTATSGDHAQAPGKDDHSSMGKHR